MADLLAGRRNGRFAGNTSHTNGRPASKVLRWDRATEFVSLQLLLTLITTAIFTDNVLVPVKLHVMAFAVLPFVIWAAIRFGMIGASLATFLVATIATVETGLGYGPFAHNTAFINAVLLDIFFAVLSASGMVLAAFTAEREHAQDERERLAREQAAHGGAASTGRHCRSL